MAASFRNQVELLLTVLPEVAKESCFALHGGTAINLFVRDMPRLSVDIDLTYLRPEGWSMAMATIDLALRAISARLHVRFPGVQIHYLREEAKLMISRQSASVKIEVNRIKRGCFSGPVWLPLCQNARREFGVYCEMQIVDHAHLYGGKICAALDRQHPRDLFDVRFLLETDNLGAEVMKGFLFYLIASNRSVIELLYPNFKDQRAVFAGQFVGMTMESFTYPEYEFTRQQLVEMLHGKLAPDDREFLISFERGEPKWHIHDFSAFPAVRWKLQNILQLKVHNPTKHEDLWRQLERRLQSGR